MTRRQTPRQSHPRQANKKARIYSRKTTQARPSVSFGSPFPPTHLDGVSEVKPVEAPGNVAEVQKQADRIMLTHYSPTGVVVTRQMEVLQFRGRTGAYLEHTHGEASLDLFKMAREGLVVDLRAATSQAIKQNIRIRREHIRVKQNGHYADIAIEVVPFQVPPAREKYYLVLFEPALHSLSDGDMQRERGRRERAHKGAAHVELVRLREEVASTRESLQAIIEEQEATNEELRSANEEIMSSNEELQSTNEELTTLNEELENRNEEADTINNDLHNLLASVNIPILILGTDLRIRRFTSAAEKLFSLIPTDVGRPITDIALKVDVPNFPNLVMEVIDSLATKELEARDLDGHWWSVRIRPYKTTRSKIDGAVVALVDIDLLKASAESISQGRAFAEAIIDTVRQPLVVLDKDLSVQSVNRDFCRTFKVTSQEILNRRIYELGDGQWDIPRLRTLLEEVLPQNNSFEDFEVTHDFPGVGRKTMRLNGRRLGNERARRALILLAMEEVRQAGGEPTDPTKS